jgi:hypothetical protein
MSSNASAIKRRVNQPAARQQPTLHHPPPRPISTQLDVSPVHQFDGKTLQQIVKIIDDRLTIIENTGPINISPNQPNEHINNIDEVIDEYNNRFSVLISEINDLKDTVMKLQSYTMEVNQTLMNERIHILSDISDENHSPIIRKLTLSDDTIEEYNADILV